jgi:cathepsin B
MRVALFCLLLSVVVISATPLERIPAINRNVINSVNSNPNSKWTAGINRYFEWMNLAEAKHLMGALKGGPKAPFIKKDVAANIPATFDARTQWGSKCPSVNMVRDQGSCGSCWAFGAVEAMTDRICIANNGASNPTLSAEDVLSCCQFVCGMGCDGGYPLSAWSYWSNPGIVTGGAYNSEDGCYPYQVAACDHHINGTLPPCGAELGTPACNETCQDGDDWTGDKHLGKSYYGVDADVSAIQTEIMTNGPVEAAMDVYEDFLHYKSGVYSHTTGDYLGGHAIKILGWGTQNGVAYWLVANSWNADWGNMGFFNIQRGTDECGIEDGIVAGLP